MDSVGASGPALLDTDCWKKGGAYLVSSCFAGLRSVKECVVSVVCLRRSSDWGTEMLDMNQPLLTDSEENKDRSVTAVVSRQPAESGYKPPFLDETQSSNCDGESLPAVVCDNQAVGADTPSPTGREKVSFHGSAEYLLAPFSDPGCSQPLPSLGFPSLPPEMKNAESKTELRKEVELLNNQGATM